MVKENITYNIDTKNLLALCHIFDDYEEFRKKLNNLLKSDNVSIKNIVNASTSKFTSNFKALRFYQENKKVIDTIKQYSYISNFIGLDDELNLMYKYLTKHQDKIDRITALITKINNLNIPKIELNEILDFSNELEYICTAFKYNFGYSYFDNIKILPNYSHEYIRYTTTKSDYKIKLGCSLTNKPFLKSIVVNNLWFNPDLLPDKITKENTFDKIVALRKNKSKDNISLRNIIDLEIGIEDIENNFKNFNNYVEKVDDIKTKQELINLLKIAKNNLEQIQSVCTNYNNIIFENNPDINEELIVKEKQKKYNDRLFAYIDID